MTPVDPRQRWKRPSRPPPLEPEALQGGVDPDGKRALTLQAVLTAALPDLGLFSPADQAQVVSFKNQVDQVVADGPGLFDGADVGTVLGAAATLIGILTNVGCQAY